MKIAERIPTSPSEQALSISAFDLASLDRYRFEGDDTGPLKNPNEAMNRKLKMSAVAVSLSAANRCPRQPLAPLASSRRSGLPPIICGRSASGEHEPAPLLLILGSAPSMESLRLQQYYAFKHNHFWHIVGGLLAFEAADLPYLQKVENIWRRRVAVWDVCESFVREGSLDSNIRSYIPNPVDSLWKRFPTIETVACNGGTAFKLFQRHFVKTGKCPSRIRFVNVPSSSPAHAMKNAIAVKTALWKKIIGESLLQRCRRE